MLNVFETNIFFYLFFLWDFYEVWSCIFTLRVYPRPFNRMLSQLSNHGVSLVKNVPHDDEENVLKVCVPFDLLYFITETASSPSFSTKSVVRV